MTTPTLHERILRLERQNRILKLGLLVLTGLVAIAAGSSKDPEVIRGQRIELVDASGVVRSQLAIDDDGAAGLFVMDDSSRIRLSATHGPDETALFIRDGAGDTRVGAAQFAHGGGGFALHGADMKSTLVLYLKNGQGSLRHVDESGAVTFEVPEP